MKKEEPNKHAAFFSNKKIDSSYTPMTLAAKSGQLAVIKDLINDGFDVNEAGEHEKTPLEYAVENNSYNITKALLEAGASVLIKYVCVNNTIGYRCVLNISGKDKKPSDEVVKLVLSYLPKHTDITLDEICNGQDDKDSIVKKFDLMGRVKFLYWKLENYRGKDLLSSSPDLLKQKENLLQLYHLIATQWALAHIHVKNIYTDSYHFTTTGNIGEIKQNQRIQALKKIITESLFPFASEKHVLKFSNMLEQRPTDNEGYYEHVQAFIQSDNQELKNVDDYILLGMLSAAFFADCRFDAPTSENAAEQIKSLCDKFVSEVLENKHDMNNNNNDAGTETRSLSF